MRITRPSKTANHVRLEWWGGSGLYVVQQSTNLAVDQWRDIFGPTNATSLELSFTGSAALFRVQCDR